MRTFAKQQFHQNSYKTLSPENSEAKMNEMQKSQRSLHNKNPQKQQLTASKTIETNICKGFDGVRKFTVKLTTNPYKQFRSKQTRLAVHDVSKSYVNTTSHKYVAKTEPQQREELHTRTMQSATPFSSSASVSMEQSINNYSLFSKETENKRSFTSDKVKFSHYNCAKKFQKLGEKHDVREHLKTQFTAT